MSILVPKFPKNIDFGENCRKIANLVKFVENLDLGQNCLIFSISIEILKNLDCGLNLQKSRIWLKI